MVLAPGKRNLPRVLEYTIGQYAKGAYVHGEGKTYKNCLVAFQYYFLTTALGSPDLNRVMFNVFLVRIKDVAESTIKRAHDPQDRNSVEEVDHLLQMSTVYLSHDLLKLIEASCRDEGVPPNVNRYADSDSVFPYWLEVSKNSLDMSLNVVQYMPYVNPHLPVLSETTKGVREDEYGNQAVIFPSPNPRPPTFRTTYTLKKPVKVDEPDIVASACCKCSLPPWSRPSPCRPPLRRRLNGRQ